MDVAAIRLTSNFFRDFRVKPVQQHLTSRNAGLIEFQQATASSNELSEQARVELFRLVMSSFREGVCVDSSSDTRKSIIIVVVVVVVVVVFDDGDDDDGKIRGKVEKEKPDGQDGVKT